VPIDRTQPNGRTIDIALARVPARKPSQRIGSILENPGGPGGSGIDILRQGLRFSGAAADRFDLVGFDPRGVGASAGLTCDATVPAFREADSGPDSPAEQADLDAKAKAVADECESTDGSLLGHVDSDDVARDMDVIRAALGDEKLTYYGFSYGTYLGELYAQDFPDRVRAIVLDGVVDPADDFAAFLRGQTVALEKTLEQMFAKCDKTPSCPVHGGTAAAYDRVAAKAEQRPLAAGNGQMLGPSELATGTIDVTYSDDWSPFYSALAAADRGNGGPMLQLAEEYYGFGSFTQYAAVECVDSAHPTGAQEFAQFAAELQAVSPRLGAAVANELLPCAFWPAPPVGHPGDVRAPGTPPILVIGNTGDAATPYEQAVKVAGNLEHGVLLTYDGNGHTAYGRSACIDDAVTAYLVDLRTPPPNTTCH
jgi:pimeloyl-ACP methyl ester carboxylesterase